MEVESKFLSEDVKVSCSGPRAVFRLPRGQGALAEAVALRIRESLSQKIPPLEEQAIQPVEDAPPLESALDQWWIRRCHRLRTSRRRQNPRAATRFHRFR